MKYLLVAVLSGALVFGAIGYLRGHPITIIVTPDDFAWWEAELAQVD